MAKTYTLTLDEGEVHDLEQVYNAYLYHNVPLTADEADTLFLLLHGLIEQGYKPTLSKTKERLDGKED